MAEGQAVQLCREAFARLEQGDETLFDDLVAEDFVNHAACLLYTSPSPRDRS